jgi:aminopeptidase N
LFPEWNIWTSFVSAPYASALSLDSLESSHPIEVEVKHPHEINEIFDTISYAKGASVIRMLHDYLGADIFTKGVRAYLRQFAYKNTHR